MTDLFIGKLIRKLLIIYLCSRSDLKTHDYQTSCGTVEQSLHTAWQETHETFHIYMYNIYAIKYQLSFSELIPINIISISLKYSPLRRSVVLCCTARLINLANCLFWYNKTNTDLSLRPIEMSPERHFYLYFLDASLRDISVR